MRTLKVLLDKRADHASSLQSEQKFFRPFGLSECKKSRARERQISGLCFRTLQRIYGVADAIYLLVWAYTHSRGRID
jgi:hypothetical protein